jgi:hypothetical protein
MSIGSTRLYKQYIIGIEREEKQAILDKNYTKLAKLSVKKSDFKRKIDEIENRNK